MDGRVDGIDASYWYIISKQAPLKCVQTRMMLLAQVGQGMLRKINGIISV
jgi:hypothetical protein